MTWKIYNTFTLFSQFIHIRFTSRNYKRGMSKFSDTIRRFNRFELKYILPISQAIEFQNAIKPYLPYDQYGDKGNYVISSLYYDSPDHRCYWEKVEGIKSRKKLRIRHYESKHELTDDSPVFVEVKQRIDKIIQKRRLKLPYKDALLLCNERVMPEKYDQKDLKTLEEIQAMVYQHNLQPSIITSYLRKAYIGTNYDLGLRITFDTNMRYRITDLDLHSKNPGRFMIPPNMVIMEIKVNESMPHWLTGLIGKHNISLIRISKFCQGLEIAEKNYKSTNYII